RHPWGDRLHGAALPAAAVRLLQVLDHQRGLDRRDDLPAGRPARDRLHPPAQDDGRHTRVDHRRGDCRSVRAPTGNRRRGRRPGGHRGRNRRRPGVENVSQRPHVLQIQGLTRRFGGLTAVDRFDVDVYQGEIVSLVGPNGAGKTTVFNLISGVLRPTAGSIRLHGRELVGEPAHRVTHHGVARTFQNIRVFPQLTVRENILLGTHHWTRSGILGSVTFWPGTIRAERAAQAEVDTAITLFRERLEPRLEDPAFTLSYANRRRTEIARALAARLKLLLLDEPAAGMN